MPVSFDKSNNQHEGALDIERQQGVTSSNRDSLRAMPDYETQQQALSPTVSGDPLVELFNRINSDSTAKSQGIEKDEVKDYLKEIGVANRMFAGTIRAKAADAFIKELDSNKDGRISYEEIQGIAAQLLPDDVFTAEGNVDPQLLEEHFRKTDVNSDQKVDSKELEAAIGAMMPEGTKSADIKAWIASLMGVDAIDFLDRDGTISREELSLIAAKAAQIKKGKESG